MVKLVSVITSIYNCVSFRKWILVRNILKIVAKNKFILKTEVKRSVYTLTQQTFINNLFYHKPDIIYTFDNTTGYSG